MLAISTLAIMLAIAAAAPVRAARERARRPDWGGSRHERGGPVRGRHQAVRLGHRGRRPQPHDRARRVLLAARAVGLRQDDDAADGGGLRAADRGPGLPRRRAGREGAAVQAQRQHGVPELRAVRPPRHRGQRRVRPQAAQGRGGRDPHARRRGARARAADRARDRAPERALRRPAPARRARAGARQPARGAAARRAAGRARPEAAQGDAGRAEGDPARGRHHVPLRHARPGGGARDVRPDRGHERRRRRAVRHAGGGLRASRRARSWPASSASRT